MPNLRRVMGLSGGGVDMRYSSSLFRSSIATNRRDTSTPDIYIITYFIGKSQALECLANMAFLSENCGETKNKMLYFPYWPYRLTVRTYPSQG